MIDDARNHEREDYMLSVPIKYSVVYIFTILERVRAGLFGSVDKEITIRQSEGRLVWLS
jgi:hypothetical protein